MVTVARIGEMIKRKYFKQIAKGRIDLAEQHSVYGTVANGIVRKEHVTKYVAIIDLECRPVSEICGQDTGHFCSIKSSENYCKLVD